jgi:hypothetical protein
VSCAGDQAQAGLGLAMGAQAGAGRHREVGKHEEEAEVDPRWISAAPGTTGIGWGGSRRLRGLITKRGMLERARKGIAVLQKRPPLAGYIFLFPC